MCLIKNDSGKFTNANNKSRADASIACFDLPVSGLLKKDTLDALRVSDLRQKIYLDELVKSRLSLAGQDADDIPSIRKKYADIFYDTDIYKDLLERYDISIDVQEIAGVRVEIFTPKSDNMFPVK